MYIALEVKCVYKNVCNIIFNYSIIKKKEEKVVYKKLGKKQTIKIILLQCI